MTWATNKDFFPLPLDFRYVLHGTYPKRCTSQVSKPSSPRLQPAAHTDCTGTVSVQDTGTFTMAFALLAQTSKPGKDCWVQLQVRIEGNL